MRTEIFQQNRGDRLEVFNAAILISDGNSNVNKDNTVVEAVRAMDAGVEMYTVAIGENPNRREMVECASGPAQDYAYELPGWDQIEQVADALLRKLCQ